MSQALLALALFAPVVAWNATHGWASLGFQGGRATAERLYPAGPLVVLAGEALYLLPWLWLAMMVAFVQALRAGPAEWRRWLPACLGLPPIVLFALVGLWTKHVMFHWAAPGYLDALSPPGGGAGALGGAVARRGPGHRLGDRRAARRGPRPGRGRGPLGLAAAADRARASRGRSGARRNRLDRPARGAGRPARRGCGRDELARDGARSTTRSAARSR